MEIGVSCFPGNTCKSITPLCPPHNAAIITSEWALRKKLSSIKIKPDKKVGIRGFERQLDSMTPITEIQ